MEVEGEGFSFNAKTFRYFKEFDDAIALTYPGLLSEAAMAQVPEKATIAAPVDPRAALAKKLNEGLTGSTRATVDGTVLTIHSDKCSETTFEELSATCRRAAADEKGRLHDVGIHERQGPEVHLRSDEQIKP